MDDTTTFTADLSSALSDTSTQPTESSTPDPDFPTLTGAAPIAPPPENSATGGPSSTETTKPKGPIPFDVHQTAMDNARKKAVEEWEQQYGWAKQVDRGALQRTMQLAQLMQADPIAGLQRLIAEVQQDPVHGAALKSLAAKALAGRSQATQEPQADLVYEMPDGRRIPMYSAEQQAKREAWLRQQVLQDAQSQITPWTTTVQQLQQERNALQEQYAIDSYVSTTHKDVLTWAGMDNEENVKAVADALQQMQLPDDDPRTVSLGLYAAYQQAVLPKLLTSQRQAVLSDLNQQAQASSVNPRQTTTKTGKSYAEMTSTADALRAELAKQING